MNNYKKKIYDRSLNLPVVATNCSKVKLLLQNLTSSISLNQLLIKFLTTLIQFTCPIRVDVKSKVLSVHANSVIFKKTVIAIKYKNYISHQTYYINSISVTFIIQSRQNIWSECWLNINIINCRKSILKFRYLIEDN